MKLTREELNDVRHAIKYFMRREISIRNPRYQHYELILEKILKLHEDIPRHSDDLGGGEAFSDWIDRRYYDEPDADSQVGG